VQNNLISHFLIPNYISTPKSLLIVTELLQYQNTLNRLARTQELARTRQNSQILIPLLEVKCSIFLRTYYVTKFHQWSLMN